MFTGSNVVMLREVGSAGLPPLTGSPAHRLRSPPKGSGPPPCYHHLSALGVEVTWGSRLRSQPWSDAPSHRHRSLGRRYMRHRLRLLPWPPKGTADNRLDDGVLTLGESAHRRADPRAAPPTSSCLCPLLSLPTAGNGLSGLEFSAWVNNIFYQPKSLCDRSIAIDGQRHFRLVLAQVGVGISGTSFHCFNCRAAGQ
jgi:hypothetical protein